MDNNFLLEHRMKLAEDYESSGKYLHALQIYNAIIDETPSFSEAVLKTASLYRKLGNLEAAERLLKDYIVDYPDNRDVIFYYGEFLLNNARWEEAVETFSYFSPEEEPVVSFFKGYAYFMMREYEISRINFSTFTSLTAQGELLYEAYFFLAKIELELKNYEAALNHLKKSEPSLSNFWEFNYLSAFTYYNMGMNAHAVTFAEKSMTLNSKEVMNFSLLGKIYLKLGDYPKAEKYLRKYIEMKESVAADAYAYLAEACLHNSKMNEAMELFDKALLTDPYNKIAIDGKKNAVDLLKRIQKASDG